MSIPGGSAAGWATRCTPSCSVACAAKGSTALWAVIALPNEPSVRLHERHGFVRIGQLVDAGYKRGGWHDVGFWQCFAAGRRRRVIAATAGRGRR